MSLASSRLHDEKTFYKAFIRDLKSCKGEAIIESPYITGERTKLFIPLFKRLLKKGVKIYVVTRDPKEQGELADKAEVEIQRFEAMQVQVFICEGNHHRKLAILDRRILWEGSLNILSQAKSREIMRRIESEDLAGAMINFLRLGRYI